MKAPNIYTIHGAEPFLIELKRDEIIQDLKKKEYFLREIFFSNDSGFKLENLFKENETSLFSEKKIIDLRLSSSLTKDNSETFIDFCRHLNEDKSLIVSIINIERVTTKKWFKEISTISEVTEIKKIYPNQFRNWVVQQSKKNSLELDIETLNLIIEKTQGNFLAAIQEIKFLKTLNTDEKTSISENSDFEIFNLSDSILTDDVDMSLKIFKNLQNKKTAEPIILWFLFREMERLILTKEDPSSYFPGPRTYSDNLRRKSSKLELSFIINLKRELAKLDRDFKMGRSDFWSASEKILIKLCNPQFFSKNPV